jgi:platelet-activating factor acetylhydrolase IB subunit beta/gamma
MTFEPVMRTDEHHAEKHARILETIKRGGIRTVFFGDSITRRWEDNADLWEKYFSRFDAVNFGVGADTLENMKWRMLNGELDGIDPEAVVFLAGTNNLESDDPATLVAKLGELLGIIAEKLPNAKLLCLALYPRRTSETGFVYAERIPTVNVGLARLCERRKIRFVDLGFLLSGKGGAGQPDPNLVPDGTHLDHNGYEAVGPELAKVLSSMVPARDA